jgi:hypothetical protein
MKLKGTTTMDNLKPVCQELVLSGGGRFNGRCHTNVVAVRGLILGFIAFVRCG